MKFSAIVTNFTTGVLSPRLFGHVDLSKFHSAAKTILNFIVMAQGGVYRRMGTYFVTGAKSNSGNIKLLKFKVSLALAYILEFTASCIRFYKGEQQIIVSGSPLEVTHSYTDDQVPDIKVAQMNDVMIVCHQDVQTQQISRFADTAWDIQDYDFVDGPYLSENITETSITPTYKGATVNYSIMGAATLSPSNAVLVGFKTDGYVEKSTDGGLTWTQTYTHPSYKLKRIRATTDITPAPLYLVTAKGGLGLYSHNGTNWTGLNFGVTNSVNDVARVDSASLFLFVGSNGWAGTMTLNILGETSISTDTIKDLNGVAYAGFFGAAVVVGDTGTVLTTTDCVTFTPVNLVFTMIENLYSIAVDEAHGKLCIVGANGTIISCTVAEGWVLQTSNTTKNLNEVSYHNGEWLVVGDGGVILTSPDCVTWKQVVINVNIDLRGICLNNTVIGGSNSILMVRKPGVTDKWYSRCSRTVELAASSSLFKNDDVGRWFRFKGVSGASVTNWTYGRIVQVTDDDAAVMEARNYFTIASATTSWRMGAFGSEQGWPKLAGFSKQRLWFLATPGNPLGVWSSMTGDFWNFGPTYLDGTVADNCSIYGTMISEGSVDPKWFVSGKKLVIGTESGEFIVKPASETVAMSPTNVDVDPETVWGVADVLPLKIGNVVLFFQQIGRKLMEFIYQLTTDSYDATDLTVLSEHITIPGVSEMVYQQNPDELIWCRRSDGKLAVLTYQRKNEVVAWHEHQFSSDAIIRAIQCKPSSDMTHDQVWFVVDYTILGTTKRYIMYMARPWNSKTDLLKTYYGVDCGVTTIVGGSPISDITHAHLASRTADVVVDGVYVGQLTANSSGKFTFSSLVPAGATLHIGLPIEARLTLMHTDPQYPTGSSQGHMKRIHRLMVRVLDTMGLSYSADNTNWHTVKHQLKGVTSPYSGLVRVDYEGNYELDDVVYFKQDAPVPCTVLSVIRELEVND